MSATLETAYEEAEHDQPAPLDSLDSLNPLDPRDPPDPTDPLGAAGAADPLNPTHRAMPRMPSLVGQLVKTVLVLGAVCLLAYVVLGRLLPRLLNIPAPGASRRIIQVVDRLPVDQKRSVMLIKLADRHYLIGVTEHGISLLSQVDEHDVDRALHEAESRPVAGLDFRGPFEGLRHWIRRPPREKNR